MKPRQIRRILSVPDTQSNGNLSTAGRHTVSQSIRLALKTGAAVTFAHWRTASEQIRHPCDYGQSLEQRKTRYLRYALAQAAVEAEHAGVESETQILSGSPGDTPTCSPDLAVISSKSPPSLWKALTGDQAVRSASNFSCPTLILGPSPKRVSAPVVVWTGDDSEIKLLSGWAGLCSVWQRVPIHHYSGEAFPSPLCPSTILVVAGKQPDGRWRRNAEAAMSWAPCSVLVVNNNQGGASDRGAIVEEFRLVNPLH